MRTWSVVSIDIRYDYFMPETLSLRTILKYFIIIIIIVKFQPKSHRHCFWTKETIEFAWSLSSSRQQWLKKNDPENEWMTTSQCFYLQSSQMSWGWEYTEPLPAFTFYLISFLSHSSTEYRYFLSSSCIDRLHLFF